MSDHKLDQGMSREQILAEVLSAEREARDVLAQAARLTADARERDLYRRLARREEQAIEELAGEADRLEAESFVVKALDV